MSDNNWAILIDTFAAAAIFISFFFYAPFLYIRLAFLLFAIAQIFIMINWERIGRGFIWVYSCVVMMCVAGVCAVETGMHLDGTMISLLGFTVTLLSVNFTLVSNKAIEE
ncbi:hypothetical protein HP456_24185 [Bacillus haikouensis]|uniref:hypothetical protein n=1 Tax=Bacillus haikouensis TaxID=1510468 RepID=UPI0015554239|nr:hypothetical protein [Bacillus haikouensis]NQD68989.1 hypothetical protein [Bacillus haikouensis]